MKLMAMEQVLVAQVVMICQRYLKITKSNEDRNEDKFNFQGQSARSKCCFDLDFDWIEETFSTYEPNFYRKIYQRYDKTKDTNTFKMFEFTIGNTKCVEEMKFHSKAPMLKYCQNLLNSCCFSSLASYFDSINQTKSANAIAIHIEESFTSQVGNRIDFENAVLKNQKRVKGEQKLYYSMKKYTKKGSFDILNDISQHVNLVQLMDSISDVNPAISF